MKRMIWLKIITNLHSKLEIKTIEALIYLRIFFKLELETLEFVFNQAKKLH